MYEKLIKVLRHCGNPNVSCKGCADMGDCIGEDGAWEMGAMSNMREAAEAIEGQSVEIEKLKKKVRSLQNKVDSLISAASWDEDIRRGQIQGMW